MRRLLLAMLCALSVAHSVAHAEDDTACRSIADRDRGRDCAPLPRVSVDHDLRVEIFTRAGSRSFPLASATGVADDLTSSCPDGTCTCEESVQYFEFKGPVPGFRQVNAAERAAAKRMRCSIENSNVDRSAMMFAVSARLVSTAISELEYCHGCGGSCHGHTTLTTYDGKTGRVLQVRDALAPGAVDALRRHMIDYIVTDHAGEDSRASLGGILTNELATRGLLDEGIYAEHGALYVNLNSFALSCAEGSFHPVPVPRELIAPSFAALLN